MAVMSVPVEGRAEDAPETAGESVEPAAVETSEVPEEPMQDASSEPIELPTHDEPSVERQADGGIVEARPTSKAEDERTLVDDESMADDDDIDDDETIDGAQAAEMPLLRERLECLKEASQVLSTHYEGNPLNLVRAADKSAGRLVNLLARDFPCFNDVHNYEGYKIRLQKRAQILVADLWACFQGREGSPGDFHDIDRLTAFADYRIPQMLHTLGVLSYSPPLDARIRRKDILESGGSWEVQLRGCSVWSVELIRREMIKLAEEENDPITVNAVLLDFHLYDTMKALERRAEADIEEGREEGRMLTNQIVPHHRTRSIWY